jgi:hypothetical protein
MPAAGRRIHTVMQTRNIRVGTKKSLESGIFISRGPAYAAEVLEEQ